MSTTPFYEPCTEQRIGLNIEQRKRLSIGVELVAKPELLLFLGMFQELKSPRLTRIFLGYYFEMVHGTLD
jgi:hypothetical protein